jgi:plastocyanin
MNTRFISIAVLSLAALALAACGSDSKNGTSTAAAPAADTTTAAATETAAAPAVTAATDTVAASGQTLTGTVGPGFTISMDQTSVPAGDYTLTVDDQSDAHNFHLTGDGVDVKTEVPEVGTKTFQITLKPGTYNFVCDPHAAQMKGELTVT